MAKPTPMIPGTLEIRLPDSLTMIAQSTTIANTGRTTYGGTAVQLRHEGGFISSRNNSMSVSGSMRSSFPAGLATSADSSGYHYNQQEDPANHHDERAERFSDV